MSARARIAIDCILRAGAAGVSEDAPRSEGERGAGIIRRRGAFVPSMKLPYSSLKE
jgi:hypothetical protein